MQAEWPQDPAAVPAHPDQTSGLASLNQLLPPLHHLLSATTAKPVKASEEEEAAPEGSSSASGAATEATATHLRFDYITIIARLDRDNPLTEAKWVRTGSADDWILSVAGSSLQQQQQSQRPQGALNNTPSMSAWKGKIKVVDPDAVRFPFLCPTRYLRCPVIPISLTIVIPSLFSALSRQRSSMHSKTGLRPAIRAMDSMKHAIVSSTRILRMSETF